MPRGPDQAIKSCDSLSKPPLAILDPFNLAKWCMQRRKSCFEPHMEVASSEREDGEAIAPDPKLVSVSGSPGGEAKQAVAWLRQDYQFGALESLIRQLALPLRLGRLSIDQLEQALVKPATQAESVAELLCKLAWPTAKQELLGKDFQGWEEVMRERLQTINGADNEQYPQASQPWKEMTPATRVRDFRISCLLACNKLLKLKGLLTKYGYACS